MVYKTFFQLPRNDKKLGEKFALLGFVKFVRNTQKTTWQIKNTTRVILPTITQHVTERRSETFLPPPH